MATSAAPRKGKLRAPEYAAPVMDRDSDQRDWARLWIANGVFWLALCTWVWTSWIVSGDAKMNKIGRGEEPDWYVALIRGWEVFALVVSIAILWWFVIRPKLKTGRFTFDGLFCLGCLMICFQEPWINWSSIQFLYSTTSVNFGSWTGHIPGWSSPNSELVPLSAWALSAYFWLVAIPAYYGSKFMRWLRARNASISRLRLIGLTFLAFCVFDIILESFITRTQLFSYGSVIPELSLWADTDHPFPIYEMTSWAGTYTVLACLHFFRDDQGRSLPERGVEKLKIGSERGKTFARWLAIMGACQLTILLTYNIPYIVYGQHAQMSPEFIDRPWRTAGVCGPDTAYDCPREDLPLATKESPTNRIDPDAARGANPE